MPEIKITDKFRDLIGLVKSKLDKEHLLIKDEESEEKDFAGGGFDIGFELIETIQSLISDDKTKKKLIKYLSRGFINYIEKGRKNQDSKDKYSFDKRTLGKLFELALNTNDVFVAKKINKRIPSLDRLSLYVGYMGWKGFCQENPLTITKYLEGNDNSQEESATIKKVQSRKDDINQKKYRKFDIRNKRINTWIAIVAAITGIILAYLSIFDSRIQSNNQRDEQAERVNLNIKNRPVFTSEKGIYKVLVLPFKYYYEDSKTPHPEQKNIGDMIYDRLIGLNIKDSLGLEIRYWDRKVGSGFSPDSVNFWREECGVDLVVCGSFFPHDYPIYKGDFLLNYFGDNKILPEEIYQRITSQCLPITLAEIVNGKLQGELDLVIHLYAAYICLDKKDYKKAIDILERNRTAENSKYFDNYIGYALFMLEKYDSAKVYFNECIEDTLSTTSDVYSNLAATLIMLKSYDLAIESCEKAIEIDSSNINAWRNKGTASLKLGNQEEALEYFNKCKEIQPEDFASIIYESMIYDDLGFYNEAEVYHNRITDLVPNVPDAWVNRAVVNIKAGHYKEAIKHLKKATILNPDDSKAWYNKGLAHLKLGEFEQAIECFKKAIDNKSDYYDALLNIGVSLDSLGNHQKANESYEQAQRLISANIDTIQKQEQFEGKFTISNVGINGESEDSLYSTTKEIDKNVSLKIQQTYSRYKKINSDSLHNVRIIKEKTKDDSVQIKNKEDFITWFIKGQASSKKRNFKEAINYYFEAKKCIDKVLEIDSSDHQSSYHKALVLSAVANVRDCERELTSGKYIEISCLAAENWYDKVIDLEPDYYYAWFQKGWVSIKVRKHFNAIKSYDKFLEAYPDNYEAWLNKGLAYEALSYPSGGLTTAVKNNCPKEYRSWLESTGYRYYDILIRKQTFEKKIPNIEKIAKREEINNFEEAIRCYDRAIKICPDSYEAWRYKGFAYFNRGQLRNALNCYDKAIEIKPDYFQAWMDKGWAILELGNNRKKAIRCFKRILRNIEFNSTNSYKVNNEGIRLITDDNGYVVLDICPNYMNNVPKQLNIEFEMDGETVQVKSYWAHRVIMPHSVDIDF